MRRSLIVSLVILLLVAVIGGLCEAYNGDLARRYTEGLAPLESDLRVGRWQQAAAQAEALARQWEGEQTWVQLWVNHAETDAVTRALHGLITSARLQDRLSAMLYFDECMENFAHLHHRDAFTLKNIL